MRAAQTRGELHIDLKSPAAIAEAEALQEGRAITTAESILAEEISNWLDTPCTEAFALDPSGTLQGFDNDEAEPEPLGLRNTVTVKDVICGMLGHDKKALGEQRFIRPVTDALALLPGWERPNSSGKLRRNGEVVRAYRRLGSSGVWTPLDATNGDDASR